jgi:D-glycero-alpha-D-manno-heptose-7-phosphate kinase
VPRLVTALAPVRICDCGGWTDTWFAGHGQVFSIAVSPYVEVQIAAAPASPGGPHVIVHAENFDERFEPAARAPWTAHPLIEAAVARAGVPPGTDLEITIHSEMPAGASTGTSAALTVALLAALRHLGGMPTDPATLAREAHAVETVGLGLESGIQDQIGAAYGGVNFIEMGAYPDAVVSGVIVPAPTWWALDSRLLLVFLGRSHDSSDVHRRVIANLQSDRGPDGSHGALGRLRQAAAAARAAAAGGDLAALGAAMCENTAAQAALHPDLVGTAARAVIALARSHGVWGWKVNGAGGDGGSLTLLAGPAAGARRRLVGAIHAAAAGWRVIPTRLSKDGVRVWEETGPAPPVPSTWP